MHVEQAQQEVRSVYLAGFPGQLVAGLVWLLSAMFGTFGSPRQAIVVLLVGASLIYPLTTGALRLMGRPTALSRDNPLRGLAIQLALVVPLAIPLVLAATLHRQDWFYPALMVAVGAHYLPFVFLYGMRQFALLSGALVGGGILIGRWVHGPFTLGGWLTGLALVGFAFACLSVALEERARPSLPE
jgi:hypothetical protein